MRGGIKLTNTRLFYVRAGAPKRLFGDQIGVFEGELRQKFEALSPGGIYSKKIRFGLYTVVKKHD